MDGRVSRESFGRMRRIWTHVAMKHLVTYPTWKKYIVLSKHVECMSVKEKRHILSILRKETDIVHDTLLPEFGMTIGEFSVFQLLADSKKSVT